jgi:CelD/BcsL family acetyltransferase involved in cellulose biosynthesis
MTAIEEVGALDAFAGDWEELALDSRNIFVTREWVSLWRRHFAPDEPLRIIGCRNQDGGLLAVLPLYTASQKGVRTIRFLGHGAGDELGPACAPSARSEAAAALRRTLETNGSDLFLADDLPGDFDWARYVGGRILRRTVSLVADLRGSSWETYLAGRSTSLRRQLGRLERRLAEQGLRYRLTTKPDELGADLDTLFALHRARWQGSPWFASGEPFHRDFAAAALERGWLRLWLMELNGRAVAAWLGYRFAGVESYYQAGRDPAWDKASVGSVLLAHTIRAAIEDDMSEYRFLRGNEGYKSRFATSEAGSVVQLARATSGLGRAVSWALAARSALRRLRPLTAD